MRYVVARDELDAECHYFSTEQEATEYFDKNIGHECSGKEEWCELYDKCVFTE